MMAHLKQEGQWKSEDLPEHPVQSRTPGWTEQSYSIMEIVNEMQSLKWEIEGSTGPKNKKKGNGTEVIWTEPKRTRDFFYLQGPDCTAPRIIVSAPKRSRVKWCTIRPVLQVPRRYDVYIVYIA